MILVWKAKHGDVFVYARDSEEELRAYKYLFDEMDELGCYQCIKGNWITWYDAAKRGDMHQARKLLRQRSQCNHEYERIETEYPVIPT
jgi:hypothetical protein